jgi:hypothetical protein
VKQSTLHNTIQYILLLLGSGHRTSAPLILEQIHKQGTCTFFFSWPGVRLGSVSLTCQVDSEHVATGEASVQLHAVRAWHEPNRAQLCLPNWPPGAKRTHDLLVEAMSFQPWRAVWRRLPDPWEQRTQVCLQVAAEQILNREWPRTVMPHMSHCRVACLR